MKKALRLHFALLLLVVPTLTSAAEQAWLGPEGQPLPFDTVDQIVDFLASAPIVASKDLSTGITKPKKLTLERDGVRLHAVFHSIDRRERQTKRLRNGEVVLHLVDSHRSQVAAFELSRLLGLYNVPPTALRKVNGREGSVQLWVENAMTEQKRRDRSLRPPDQVDWSHQKADQWIFDNLINNIDRNTGNTLIDGSWNIWLIDHTRSFGRDRGLPYPERISSISRDLWVGLKNLDPEEVRERLAPHMGKSEVRGLLVRREKLIAAVEERIARLGEERVVLERGQPWISIEKTRISELESSSEGESSR